MILEPRHLLEDAIRESSKNDNALLGVIAERRRWAPADGERSAQPGRYSNSCRGEYRRNARMRLFTAAFVAAPLVAREIIYQIKRQGFSHRRCGRLDDACRLEGSVPLEPCTSLDPQQMTNL